MDYIEEVATRDPNVHFPTPVEQTILLEAVLAKYADSAYLDTVAPSDHAKKVFCGCWVFPLTLSLLS